LGIVTIEQIGCNETEKFCSYGSVINSVNSTIRLLKPEILE